LARRRYRCIDPTHVQHLDLGDRAIHIEPSVELRSPNLNP
jgi:hypothetical protein